MVAPTSSDLLRTLDGVLLPRNAVAGIHGDLENPDLDDADVIGVRSVVAVIYRAQVGAVREFFGIDKPRRRNCLPSRPAKERA